MKMLDDTWSNRVFIRAIILFLQSLGPGCVAFTAWSLYDTWPQWPSPTLFFAWSAAETAFFIAFLFYRIHLQGNAIHPPLRSKDDRRALFAQVRREIHDPEKYLSGWFRGAKVEEIGRDELRSFLDWAFWDGRAQLGTGGSDEEEMEEYTRKIEYMMPRPFQAGKGTAKSLRLTLDAIQMECRTIAWYILMMLADTITHFWMVRIEFRYFKTTTTSLQVFPPRPAAATTIRKSPVPDLSYWYRPHTSRKRLPILYIHGIGIGLLPHIKFLTELKTALHAKTAQENDGEVGILVLEILQVSSRLTNPILRREEFVEQLTRVLDCCGFDRFVVASHSYGSVLNTHILTHEPLASRVAATFLIDPVTVLLHMPDVAYNFIARPPKKANEWELCYFASRDPGVAHTLGRHFFWSENVLWRDHIIQLVDKGMKFTASLAQKDLIVDTEPVGIYLTEHQIPDPVLKQDDEGRPHMELRTEGRENNMRWKDRRWRGEGVEVIWWDEFDHAQVFDKIETRARLVEVLVEYSESK